MTLNEKANLTWLSIILLTILYLIAVNITIDVFIFFCLVGGVIGTIAWTIETWGS